MIRIFCFLFFSNIGLSCIYYEHKLPYDFEEENAVHMLGEELEEISALTYKNDSTLYSLNDEEGKIFEINVKSGDHREIIRFKKKGDFEGLAYLKPFLYVLKSDGDIYKVASNGKYTKSTFKKNKGFDFEGLCLHPKQPWLVVACKTNGNREANEKYIWLYRYSLLEEKYDPEPFLKYTKKEVHPNFQPSALSFSPDGELYVLSGRSYTLAVFDADLELKEKAQLPYLRFQQAEGICFAPDKTLFISSEKGEQMHAKLIQLHKKDEEAKK